MPTVEELQEKTARYFQKRHSNFPEGPPYDCCESALLTLGEYPKVESDLIPRVATGIGVGFSLDGFTCCLISGAAIAIDLKYGRKTNEWNPKDAWQRVDKFIGVFTDKFGAVTCREL